MGHAEMKIQDALATKTISMDEYWMPFTPNRDFKHDPKMIVRAEGMYLWNERGDRLIDASSGLFCVNAGHCRKEIAQAVGAQLAELDFIAPFTRGHPKQFELASRVAALTPGDLNRIFFTNSGSESVDTAMKVALAYWQAKGQGGRTMFISRERAYHGVNFGGVSLAGMANNRRRFGPTLPGIAHMRHTHVKENFFQPGEGSHGVELAEDLVRLINLYGAENIAACFVEPIAGSTGCLVPPKGYLKRLREICDAQRHPARVRRGDHGLRANRPGVRGAELRRHAGPDDDGQGHHERRAADGGRRDQRTHPRHDHGRSARGRHRVLPRLHVLGAPGRVRSRPRDARHLRARRPVRAGPCAVAVFPRGPVLAARHPGRRRHPRLRHDRRDRCARPKARRASGVTRCRRSCSTMGCISRPPATRRSSRRRSSPSARISTASSRSCAGR